MTPAVQTLGAWDPNTGMGAHHGGNSLARSYLLVGRKQHSLNAAPTGGQGPPRVTSRHSLGLRAVTLLLLLRGAGRPPPTPTGALGPLKAVAGGVAPEAGTVALQKRVGCSTY